MQSKQVQMQHYHSVLLLTALWRMEFICIHAFGGLTWHGLIGGQHEVAVEIVSCVQKLKLTRHECCFPPAQSL